MIDIIAIQQHNNQAHEYVAGVYDCNVFAGHNYRDVIAAGIDPKRVRFGVAKYTVPGTNGSESHEEFHMVVEVLGSRETTVMDSRLPLPTTKKFLVESLGYKFILEGWPNHWHCLTDWCPALGAESEGRLKAAIRGEI